jgi:hypothetical protein
MAHLEDLDETRRLLLMALCAPATKRYNLAGTLANALLYHQHVAVDRDALLSRVIAAVDGDGDAAWLWEQVDRVNTEIAAQ